MKIWIDMSAPAHVLVFRPIIPRLRAAGHEVEVTARDYAQTLDLLELHGMEHEAFVPGAVKELRRAIWHLGTIRVHDGAGNLFLTQGIWVP